MNVELFHHPCSVSLDGVGSDVEFLGGLFHAQALGAANQDLDFTLAQSIRIGVREMVNEIPRDSGGKRAFPLDYIAQGFKQFGWRSALEKIAMDSRLSESKDI